MIQNRDVLWGELFVDVQLSGIFPDSKTFVDCVAKIDSTEIKSRYALQKDSADFDLKQFILDHFNVPESTGSDFKTDLNNTAEEHVHGLWDVLARTPSEKIEGSSLIPLPHPYIVPGGRFREIYYWDSYFTMVGLLISGKREMVENMLDNFAHLIDVLGFIPNGNRSYFNSRSQPPFFALMIDLLRSTGSDVSRFQDALQKEYEFWMQGSRVYKHEGVNVNRYWDNHPIPRQESYKEDFELAENFENKSQLYLDIRAACESGWDFSSRWFEDPADLSTIKTTSILPVDLNCLIYCIEYSLGKDEAAQQRADWINQYCWNEEKQFYFDYDLENDILTDVHSAAALFPLFVKIASEDQAAAVAGTMEKTLLQPGGLSTTNISSGQQWDAPNGWAPLQWIAVQGLSNYGHIDLAKDIASRWVSMNENVFKQSGKFVEKYNVFDLDLEAGGGEYPVQDGFGWSNGVYLGLKEWLRDHP